MALVAALLAGALAVGGCGEDEEELDVIEGEPVELGELRYNVQITRFPQSERPRGRGVSRGQPDASPDEEYLGVFMTIENESDSSVQLPDEMTVVDTRKNTYEPRESESVYALELGATLEGGDELPAPDTPAATGPINGAMVLFLVNRSVTENRPIELEIPSSTGEEARVELDI